MKFEYNRRLRWLIGSATACLVCGAGTLSAQNAILRGRVTDPSGLAISSASIDVIGTLWRATTQANGTFSVAIPAGRSFIRVRQLGFLPESIAVAPPFDSVIVILIPHPVELKGVTVVGGGTPPMGRTVTAATVRQVPPLGEPDIFRAVVLLPGVSQPNDLKGRIHLAGGTSDETGVELNGHPLQDPFHLLGMLGAFNIAALDRADVSIHYLPAASDGRLSGSIALQSRHSATAKREAVVSLLSAGLTVLQPQTIAGFNVLVSARITYLDRLLGAFGNRAKVNRDEQSLLGYRDAILTVDRSFKNTSVDAVYFYTRDRRPVTTAGDYSWGESLGGISTTTRTANWIFASRASLDRATSNLGGMGPRSVTEQRVRLRHDWASAQLSLKRLAQTWSSEGGIGIDARETDQDWTGAPEGFFTPRTPREYVGSKTQTRPVFFGEVSKTVGATITATVGARMTRLEGRAYAAPRALLAKSFRDGTNLSLGLGRRYQFDSELEEPIEGSGKQPMFLISQPRIADVAAVSLRRAWTSADWEFVSFYKRYKDRTSLRGNPRAFADSTGTVPDGFPVFDRIPGRSYGAAASFTRHFGSRSLVQGSYTFQKVSERIDGDYSPTAWDSPHAVSAFVTTPISRQWTFNIVSQWHSGASATPVSARIFVPDPDFSPFLRPRYIPGDRNSGRLPDYRRVDIGVRRESKRGKTEVAFSAQILNILARRNPLEYDWASAYCSQTGACKSSKPTRSGLPIIPSLGLEIRW